METKNIRGRLRPAASTALRRARGPLARAGALVTRRRGEPTSDRPGLAALIERAKGTPGAVVVCYSVSRLARRQRLLWTLLDDRDGYGLSVSSATESFDTTTPMGRAMLGMIAVFAALEADMVSERTKDGLGAARAKGIKMGAPSMVELGARETVRMVQAMYAAGGFTHRSLADELNRRELPTATGRGKWWPKTVRSALLAVVP